MNYACLNYACLNYACLKRSSDVPWISREIKTLISDRDKLKRKAMLTKLDIDWDHYKISRNKVNVALRHGKSAYYRCQ